MKEKLAKEKAPEIQIKCSVETSTSCKVPEKPYSTLGNQLQRLTQKMAKKMRMNMAVAQSICTYYSSFRHMCLFATLKLFSGT